MGGGEGKEDEKREGRERDGERGRGGKREKERERRGEWDRAMVSIIKILPFRRRLMPPSCSNVYTASSSSEQNINKIKYVACMGNRGLYYNNYIHVVHIHIYLWPYLPYLWPTKC